MIDDKVELCDYYVISRSQRKHEVERGVGLIGTISFEELGCYECEGNNTNCNKYFNIDKYIKEHGG